MSDDSMVRSARQRLQQEIQEVLWRYQASHEKPPFSTEELIVMAIAHSADETAGKTMIFAWILKHFKFYANEVLLEFTNNLPQRKMECKYDVALEDFLQSFNAYEVPLTDARYALPANKYTARYITTPSEARCFLRNVLEPKRRGSFRFLDLPAELRVRIYEMVFSYPKIRIGPLDNDKLNSNKHLYLTRRAHDPIEYSTDEVSAMCFPQSKSFQPIFALLSVNKQIHYEAVPYFYRINFFNVGKMRQLMSFSINLAPSRMQHLRQIHFPYSGTSSMRDDHNMIFSVLAQHKALRVVEIRVKDRSWLRSADTPRRSVLKFGTPGLLPGMGYLCKILQRAEKFSFRGECPRISQYIQDEVVRLKSGAPPAVLREAPRTVAKKSPKAKK